MPLTNEQKQAAQYILDHAHGLRAMLELADSVKSVETTEALAGEAETRVSNAKRELASIEKRIEKAKDAAKAAEAAKRADTEAAAQLVKDAAAKVRDADSKSKAILTDASDKAAAILEDAKARAEKMVKAVTDDLDERIVERKAKLTELAASEEELSVIVVELEKRADKARKYLANLAKED